MQPQQVANPFAGTANLPSNAAANSDETRAIQEVQAAMTVAKKFPRDYVRAMDSIINACTRPTLANAALYSYPRGNQEITGPSIRLAEAMAQAWGNMQYGARELSADNGCSTIEAFAWDMQTNTRVTKTFQVVHERHTRNGAKKLTDPRDIYELTANQGSRRVRACILAVIPSDVVDAAIQQCEETQAWNVVVTPESIKSMLDAFANNYGVKKEHIEARIGKRAEAINPPQMLNLKKIYQSLKDGMSRACDWFEVDEQELIESGTVSDLVIKPKSAPGPEPKPEPQPEPEPEAVQQSEPEPEPEELPINEAWLKAQDIMDNAENFEQLSEVIGHIGELDDDTKTKARFYFAFRRAQIDGLSVEARGETVIDLDTNQQIYPKAK